MRARLTGALGVYELLERVSIGGMAEVYRARRCDVSGFEPVVAIKRILPALARDELFVSMFVDEARVAAQLSHPNIAKTLDLGVSGDEYFIALEYIAGVDVRTLFTRCCDTGSSIPLRHACRIVAEVCDALSYAHNKRDAGGPMHIVHRDVSPANVLVSSAGEVKLIDFGVVKSERRRAWTRDGTVKGKPAYLAPEQLVGEGADYRCDIFAAGVLLWELLTRERLFHGEWEGEILQQIERYERAPAPSTINPAVPPELDAIVAKALCRDPDDRYRDAAELQERLCTYARRSGEQSSARSLSTWIARVLSNEPGSWREAPTSMRWPTASAQRAPVPCARRTNVHVTRRLVRAREPSAPEPVETLPAPMATSRVAFESDPPGADVVVISPGACTSLGTTPVASHLDHATSHEVSIRKPGYAPWSATLALEGTAALTVTATLVPQRAIKPAERRPRRISPTPWTTARWTPPRRRKPMGS